MKRLLILLLLAPAMHAATFILAPDDETIRAATAVVVARAGESHARRTDRIETVTSMSIEESIRGDLAGTIDVVHIGGFVDDIGLAVAGSPRFIEGERVLLLLERNHKGQWTARNFIAGVFRFQGDHLLRDEELCGYDAHGNVHREPRRLAQPFLRFVREVARGGRPNIDYIDRSPRIETHAGPASSTYLIRHTGSSGTLGIRWSTFPTPVVFRSHGEQPGALNGGLTAVDRSLNAWTNDGGSSIVYQYAGTTTRNSGFVSSDQVNSIQFNDPSNEIEGSYRPSGGSTLAIGGAWFGSGTHAFGTERFYTIREADLVIQNGLSGSGLTGNGFDHVVAHEFGHTLGFRHSDDPPEGGSQTENALMNSSVAFNNDPTGAALLGWDREAAAAVYGSGPACVPPAITQQPRSVSVTTPENVTLTVAATGDAPLAYQWYAGTRGVTTAPLSERTPSITVRPATTTSYWVRVTNGCDPPADSDTATITIAGCPAVGFDATSGGTTILQGRSVTLTAAASGGTISYQWFTTTGASAGSGPSITVTPSTTTSYFARATNSCGATADSAIMTVTVIPCDAPSILIQPVGGDVETGTGATFYAKVVGSAPLQLRWYEGPLGDRTRPVPNAITESITTPSLFTSSRFWLEATNDCGEARSAVAEVAIAPNCRAPQIVSQPDEVRITTGETTFITVQASGTSLVYRWYQGPLLDFTRPVGGSGPTLYTGEVGTATQYWVRIENGCGSINSRTIDVTPVAGARRRAVRSRRRGSQAQRLKGAKAQRRKGSKGQRLKGAPPTRSVL